MKLFSNDPDFADISQFNRPGLDDSHQSFNDENIVKVYLIKIKYSNQPENVIITLISKWETLYCISVTMKIFLAVKQYKPFNNFILIRTFHIRIVK